jgi:plastocyanin
LNFEGRLATVAFMKIFIARSLALVTALLFVSTTNLVAADDATVLKMKVKKINGAAHWTPSPIHVKQGQKVKFEVTYDLEGGFPNHNFSIEPLHINAEIDRGKTVEIPATIDLKPGTYEIRCAFHHPSHVDAQLIVEPGQASKGDKPAVPAEKK